MIVDNGYYVIINMEATYPAKAIILKREPRGEYDSRVAAYTRERGKLELIARGTKKIKSKLAGHLEPLCFSDIMVVRGRRFDYIGSAVSEHCSGNIKSDLDKLIAAGRAVNVFNSLVKENLKDEKLYCLLEDYIYAVNSKNIRENNHELLADLFLLKLITLLGHTPELDKCVICGKKITPGGNIFNFIKGGIVGSNCRKKEAGKSGQLTISDNCIKIMRLAISEKIDKLKAVNIDEKLKKEVGKIISSFKNYQI